MSVSREDTLKQFCDVTGADETRSKFFLESSNWMLEVALSSFYEHGGNIDEGAGHASAIAEPVPVLSDSDMESPPGSPLKTQLKDKKPKRGSQQKFATLSSLQQDNSSSDEEEGQAFYAGGSDRSGQQIIGPGKKDVVTEMFKSVRARGAVVFEDEPTTTSRGGTFSGTGYRLGQTPDDHVTVGAANTGQAQDEPRFVRIRMYREGFAVDDGALQLYSDPENAEFLTYIKRGVRDSHNSILSVIADKMDSPILGHCQIPPSLQSERGEVRVSLEDHRHEECPRQGGGRGSAFAGKGHLLGSPTPATVGATSVPGDVQDRAANERAAQDALRLDQTLPTTSIQFRLADGSRLTGRFNHTHTVGDLRRYLTLAVPIYQLQNFALMTTFPSAELSDTAATLQQANLLNSVVVQRLK